MKPVQPVNGGYCAFRMTYYQQQYGVMFRIHGILFKLPHFRTFRYNTF